MKLLLVAMVTLAFSLGAMAQENTAPAENPPGNAMNPGSDAKPAAPAAPSKKDASKKKKHHKPSKKTDS